jgi:AcrR family transcriptional regulator
MAETKERILDTAERLFAERGYGATSLRSIIAAANVNLAAVHYHFRTKEALLEAVLKRRLEPVNRERLAMLEECEKAAGDAAPCLECVLNALIAAPLRLAGDPAYAAFVKLMGRVVTDGDADLIRKHFGDVMARFLQAFHRAVPELSPDELLWRGYFAVAILAHTLVGTKSFLGIQGPATAERLVSFISAGFRAPATTDARSGA